MTINEALRTFVLADASIAATIAARFYHMAAPTDAVSLPYVIYKQARGEYVRHLAGGSSFCRYTFELQVFASGGEAAYNLADDIRKRLDNYKGALTVGFAGEAYLLEQTAAPTFRHDSSEIPIYAYVMLFDVWTPEVAVEN